MLSKLPLTEQQTDYTYSISQLLKFVVCLFLPRCIECRRAIAMRILSVRLSAYPSVSLSVTHVHCDKTAKNLSRF